MFHILPKSRNTVAFCSVLASFHLKHAGPDPPLIGKVENHDLKQYSETLCMLKHVIRLPSCLRLLICPSSLCLTKRLFISSWWMLGWIPISATLGGVVLHVAPRHLLKVLLSSILNILPSLELTDSATAPCLISSGNPKSFPITFPSDIFYIFADSFQWLHIFKDTYYYHLWSIISFYSILI